MMRLLPDDMRGAERPHRQPSFVATDSWLKWLTRECEADPSLAIVVTWLLDGDTRVEALRAAARSHAGPASHLRPIDSIPLQDLEDE